MTENPHTPFRPSRRHALGLAAAAGASTGVALAAGGGIASAAGKGGAHTAGLPQVLPVPQKIRSVGKDVNLGGRVTVVVGRKTDDAAQDALLALLKSAGANVEVVTAKNAAPSVKGVRVYLGTLEDNPALPLVLEELEGPSPKKQAAGGYVIATGRSHGQVAVLAGTDALGTFYAVQTLRQLVGTGHKLAAVEVRDWPLMPIRGAIEGFYGIPWSHRARLDLFAFLGEHKLNTYIYTPKDDLLLRAKWRDLYEGEALDDLAELVETAYAHHVEFTYAISPGNDILYSSDEDFTALCAKFDQLRDLGVTSFYIALDDIPPELEPEDEAEFGDFATAQAHLLNRVQREYIVEHDLEPLQTVPTHYTGSEPSQYKTDFGEKSDDAIRIQWTGEGVFSPTVTAKSAATAEESYHTEHLYVWDNFPVNDGRRDRLFLNPLEGRDPSLHQYLDGFTSNPMIEPYASWPAIAGYADYTWNPLRYDAETSMRAVLDELAGPNKKVRRDLDVFVDLNVNWPYREGSPEAPALGEDIEAFWKAYADGEKQGGSALETRLDLIADLPEALTKMRCSGFTKDVNPWSEAAAQYGTALSAQVAMLWALREDRLEDASAEAKKAAQQIALAGRPTVPDQRKDGVFREDQIVPSVGDGRFQTFIQKAWDALREKLPDDPSLPFRGLPATATTTLAQYKDNAPEYMVDGDLQSKFWSSKAPKVDDEIRIELEEEHDLGYVAVHMATSDDTAADQIYHGDLEVSTDGTTWTKIGAADGKALLEVTPKKPVAARIVRLRVTAKNPGGKWVQVREFAAAEQPPAS